MNKICKQLLAFALSVIMLLGVVPVTAFAAYDYAHNEAASSDGYYQLISKKDWDIAPGIKETEIVLNNDAGDRRQVIHLMEADISNPYTRVISSYTNMDTSNYAISTIPEHAAFIENEWGENVVGAMNTCLSWYNSAAYAQDPSRINEPLGFMMVDGDIYFDHSVGFPTCIVIHKDVNENGEARPADIPKVEMRTVTDTSCLNGWEDQVIPSSSGYIVKDGVNQYTAAHGSDTAARSVVGVKADGSIVIMMNDGRQSPYSLGMNMYECAEVMIAAGCVYAANCDGGGSSTFMSQRPGEELEVNCSPCDGALRQNTHGIIFISTAPATGEFDNAYLKTENDYYVPNSTVAVEAVGRDFSGAEAEIPDNVTWALIDDSFGSVANGVFTSNGKTGDVTIQMIYNDTVVGSKTIHIVNPESVTFAQASTVIPYGKSIALEIEATYGEFNVGFTAADFTWTVSDATAGVLDGFTYTATNDESKTGTQITATYKYADLGSAVLDITFGKGSEVMWDFENGDVSNWMGQEQVREWLAANGIPESGLFPGGNYSEDNSTRTFLSSVANGGQVKKGQYALGLEVDYSYSRFSEWSYTVLFNVEGQTVLRDVANGKNATKLGMWVYIPEGLMVGSDMKGLAMQFQLYGGTDADHVASFGGHLLTADGKNLLSLTEADIPEDRWVYFYIDLTSKNYVSLQDPTKQTWREPSFIRFYTQHYTPKNLVFYFDELTLDYSDAVDDRDAPVISNVTINTVGNNKRSFNASVADFVASNASGLNYNSAKIYVDGVALPGVSAANGTISSPEIDFTNGTHTVTFEITDNMGNTTKKSQTFTIAGTVPVTLGGHNDLNNLLEYDSVYYVDINVADIQTISEITAVLDLNTAHKWEAEYFIVAEGFTATTSVNKYANTVTITVTKTGKCSLTGAQTLVSIPTRVWSWRDTSVYTKDEIFATGLCPIVPYNAKVVSGSVSFVDGVNTDYVGTFSGSISATTNLNDNKVEWHEHTPVALDDKAVTCLTDGYTGRTYCDVCGSVVDWGTIIKAEGHDYQLTEGALKCACGELFNGEIDGVTYVDGVIVNGWVNDTYYFVDGVKLTGSHYFDGKMHTFDENGVYMPDYLFDGFYEIEDTVMYFVGNNYITGSQRILGQYYNFYKNGLALDGEVNIGGFICTFDNGLSVANKDVTVAGICGEDAFFVLGTDETMTICGSGAMTDYIAIGNNPWLADYSRKIKKVVIGKDITVIGKRAFQYCYDLASVEFEAGSQLKSIHTHGFSFCRDLTSIVLPEGLEEIQTAAFQNALNIEYIYVPESLVTFHSYAFGKEMPANLTLDVVAESKGYRFAVYHGINYTIRATVKDSGTCGENATWEFFTDGKLVISGTGAIADFSYDKTSSDAAPWAHLRGQIKTVIIGKDITAIGAYSFYSCNALTAVVFEDGSKLADIGVGAFGYTSALKSVVIPASVKNIGKCAFYFSGLEIVAFEENSALETIGETAFRNCTSLKSIYLPDGVKAIYYDILYNCGDQVLVSVASGTYAYRYAVRYGYTYEEREAIPTVLYSGTCGENATWALYSNGKLIISGSGAIADYTYEKKGETAAPWALYRGQIKTVVIGKDITAIGAYNFYSCNALTAVVFEDGSKLADIGVGAFGYTAALKSVVIPASVKNIGKCAFYFSGLETVAFEAGSKLETIGETAFRNCTALTSIYLPDGVKAIYYDILYNCGDQAVVSVASGTYAYRYAVRYGYTYEEREPIPTVLYSGTCGENAIWELYTDGKLVISGTGAIADYTYEKTGANAAPWAIYRAKITTVVIGKDITAIGAYNFYSCNALTAVVFEDGSKLADIGVGAFGYTAALKSVVIPASVKNIGKCAFYFSGLETVAFAENSQLETIGETAFRNCTALTSIVLPASVKAINYDILYNCGDQVVVSVVNGSYAYRYAVRYGYTIALA